MPRLHMHVDKGQEMLKTRNNCIMIVRLRDIQFIRKDGQGTYPYCLNFEHHTRIRKGYFLGYKKKSTFGIVSVYQKHQNIVVFLRSTFPNIIFYSFMEIVGFSGCVHVCVLKNFGSFMQLFYICFQLAYMWEIESA